MWGSGISKVRGYEKKSTLKLQTKSFYYQYSITSSKYFTDTQK